MTQRKPSQYYRERAKEARLIAESFQDANVKRQWLNIAVGFEALANHIDAAGGALEKQALSALKIRTDKVIDPLVRRRLQT
jgi:hypothetical protein